jgi:hypothetical protein
MNRWMEYFSGFISGAVQRWNGPTRFQCRVSDLDGRGVKTKFRMDYRMSRLQSNTLTLQTFAARADGLAPAVAAYALYAIIRGSYNYTDLITTVRLN